MLKYFLFQIVASVELALKSLFFSEHCYNLRGSQLWYFTASRPSSEEPEEKGAHDFRAAMECRPGYSAVWSVLFNLLCFRT